MSVLPLYRRYATLILLYLDGTLPLPPPAPVETAISDALATIATDEMTLEAYNVQYLQRHSGNAGAVLGAAKGLQILGGSRDEVEGIVFGILNPEVDLSLKVSHRWLFQRVYQLNAAVYRPHLMCGHSSKIQALRESTSFG